jgi:Rps23 Pro-64 3,4-dihydroxylase Tpa1-like proline 4-hydroxylase
MIDRRCLESWIQPQHLEDQALERYRNAFSSHPAGLVVLKEFLVGQLARKLSQFLTNEAEFKPEYGLYSIEGPVQEEKWLVSQEQDRFFRLRKMVGTPKQFQMSPNALSYLQFRKTFQRPEFRAFFEVISRLSLGWSDDFGAHSMVQGDYLRPHSDDNCNRQLAVVIYLTQGWRRDFGGLLRVIHEDGNLTEIEPEYNSMIAFDVLTAPAHLVLPIEPAAGQRQRLSIGGWYQKTTTSISFH